MPRRQSMPLPLTGLGSVELMEDHDERGWADCDRARLIGSQRDTLTTWGGCNRVGMALYKPELHGANDANRIAIMRACQRYVRKASGHVLAAVDMNASNSGRILGLAFHPKGINGCQLVHEPVQTTGSGLDDLETRGVWTDEDSSAIVAVRIDNTGSPDTFRWSLDGGDNWDATGVSITGGWQTLSGGIQVRFGATTGHTLNNEWTFCAGGRPGLANTMHRPQGHTYPAFAGAAGKTLITHGLDRVLVDDGRKVRDAGLRAPRIQPQASSIGNLPGTGLGIDIGRTEENPVEWVALADGVTVARATATPSPADGSAYVEITPPYQYTQGKMLWAYVNTSGTIPATARRIKGWIQVTRSPVDDYREPEKMFGIALFSGADCTGTRVNVTINNKLPGYKWVHWDRKWEEGEFAYASIALYQRQTMHENPSTVLLDKIEVDGDADAAADAEEPAAISSVFTGPGEWRFCFTWLNRETGQESAPSPVSDALDLDGTAASLDLSGAFPGMPGGGQNAAPAGADAVHIYAWTDSFGVDSRTQGYQFFRVTPAGGIAVGELVNETTAEAEADAGNTGNGTLSGLRITGEVPSQTITVTALGNGPTASFSVVGSVSGAFDNATSGSVYKSATGAVRFEISDGGTAWQTGDHFDITVTTEAREDGKLIATLADPLDQGDITSQPKAPFFLQIPQPGHLAIADGNLIVTAIQPSYEVGEFTWTNGSAVITPVDSGNSSTTPEIGVWMEGRTIKRRGEDKTYYVVRALDTNDDGVLDALWIASQFDSKENEFIGIYDGTTGDGKAIIGGDEQSIWWTNNTGELGVDVESSSPLNTLRVMPAGDRIVGGGKSGEFLWILGSKNTFVLRQDPGALSDIPETTAYSNPLHLPDLGLMARRCWAPLPDGTALFISRDGELMIANGNTYRPHPASDRLKAFLAGYGLLTDTDQLAHAWMAVIRSVHGFYLYIGLPTAFDDSLEQTDSSGRRTELDPGVLRNAISEYVYGEEVYGSPVLTSPFQFAACETPEGAAYIQTAVENDFNFGVLVDLAGELIFTGRECRFSGVMVDPASGCSIAGMMPGPAFFGDLNGHIQLALDDRLITWGNPDNIVWFEVDDATPGTSTTIVIDSAWDLSVDPDGDGRLIGLVVCKLSTDGTAEFRRIVDNDETTITIGGGATWDTNPVASDRVLVAPLPVLVQWHEWRFRRPAVMRQFGANEQTDANWQAAGTSGLVDDPSQYQFDVFRAAGNANQADLRNPAATVKKTAAEFEKGRGLIELPAKGSKALALRMRVLPGQMGPWRLRNPQVLMRINEGESGR